MELTAAQLLLLNNLMYLKSGEDSPLQGIECAEGETIGSFVSDSRQHPELLAEARNYGSFMTGADWKKILGAVQTDPVLSGLQIRQVRRAPEEVGGGLSAWLATPDHREAVLVFKGTEGPLEWADNFAGGAGTDSADGVSTSAQQSAAEWVRSLDLEDFRTVTVTGHSKGGNKAKYLAICEERITRCVSFDGQGFSDEFMERYEREIRERQHRIHNYNAASDYVNLLLNDVGASTFCEGYDYGRGGFLENHCPNTILCFGAQGEVSLVPAKRDSRMAALDRWLNRSLRALPAAERAQALPLVGQLVQQVQEGKGFDQLLSALLLPGSLTSLTHLIQSFKQEFGSTAGVETGGDHRIAMPLSKHCVYAVNPGNLLAIAEELSLYCRQEQRLIERASELPRHLTVSLQSAISARLAAAEQSLRQNCADLQRLAELLSQTAARYEAAERQSII